MTVRIDRVRAMVVATVSALVGVTPVWARGLYPNRASSPVIVAGLARGPAIGPTSKKAVDDPTVLRLVFADTVPGSRVGFRATGAKWYADAGVDDTATRDALLEVFTENNGADFLGADVVVTADGADAILFTASAPARLWGAVAIGSGVTLSTVTTAEREIAQGTATMVIELQAYSPGGGPDAAAVLGDIVGGLDLDVAVAIRDAWGVGFHGSDEPVDLTSIAGAHWQSRAACRWRLSTLSYKSAAINVIDEMDASITVHGAGDPITIEVEEEEEI